MGKKCPDYAPYVEKSGECTVFCDSGNFEVAEKVSDTGLQSLFCLSTDCPRYYLEMKDSLKKCVSDCSTY